MSGNYIEPVRKMGEELAKRGPGLHHVHILHDDLCNVWHKGPCNCNPTVLNEEQYNKLRKKT